LYAHAGAHTRIRAHLRPRRAAGCHQLRETQMDLREIIEQAVCSAISHDWLDPGIEMGMVVGAVTDAVVAALDSGTISVVG